MEKEITKDEYYSLVETIIELKQLLETKTHECSESTLEVLSLQTELTDALLINDDLTEQLQKVKNQ